MRTLFPFEDNPVGLRPHYTAGKRPDSFFIVAPAGGKNQQKQDKQTYLFHTLWYLFILLGTVPYSFLNIREK